MNSFISFIQLFISSFNQHRIIKNQPDFNYPSIWSKQERKKQVAHKPEVFCLRRFASPKCLTSFKLLLNHHFLQEVEILYKTSELFLPLFYLSNHTTLWHPWNHSSLTHTFLNMLITCVIPRITVPTNSIFSGYLCHLHLYQWYL